MAHPAPALGQDGELRERLFVLRAERPGVPLQVTSLRGGDEYRGTTDDAGLLFFSLRVANDDELRFQSASERWDLDWVEKVKSAHVDADVPLELDIGAFLDPRSPKPKAAPNAAPNATPNVAVDAENRRDHCTDADDIQCLLRRQRQLSEARRRGDCRQALELADQLIDDLPDLASGDSAAAELAALHLECALFEEAEGDVHGRSELLLRRAVALAAGADGGGWCDAQRSRILAAAYGELRETAAAAGAARQARARCPERSGPAEWEFFFRIGLGQASRAAEVAQSVDGELGAYLAAWAEHAAGRCPADVARWIPLAESVAETPCTVLPDGFCLRARNAWLMRCADDQQLDTFSASLRAGLETLDDPSLRRRLVEDLAELEYSARRLDAAARQFDELRQRAEGSTRRGLWACRLGSALLRADRWAEALEAFEDASASWAGSRLDVSPVASPLDRLVVENNALVLASALRGQVDVERLASVRSQLAELATWFDGSESSLRPWRLAIENNLLELRTRAESQRAEDGDAREVLERLRLIESDYRRHVRSVSDPDDETISPGTSDGALVACSALAFASDVSGAQE